MSTLIVQLPAQPRLSAQASEPRLATAEAAEWAYVLSTDGVHATRQGLCAPADLPRAQTTVAVLAPADVAWHRVTAPKAPAARLRAALAGLLEEALLDDDADLHLATSPGWKAGEPAWVAAIGKARLKAQIELLKTAGHAVDRLVPAWGPGEGVAAHVFNPGDGRGPQLAWRDESGPLCLPLAGGGARGLLARQAADLPVLWSTSPDCATDAAQLAGDTVAAVSHGEFLLAAARAPWNLRQFDLAPQRRSSRVAREAWRRFLQEPAWRPVRWGLLAVLGVQLLGVNVWAWQQRHALAAQKTAMTSLLQTTFPQVRAVIDPPVQMQKEVDLLRSAAGQPGDADLEPMLSAANTAWPPSRGPADSIKFEPGRLTLGSPGWSPAEVSGFQERLRPLGLAAESQPGLLVLSRLAPGAAPRVAAAAPTRPAPAAPTAPQPSAQATPPVVPVPGAAVPQALPPQAGPAIPTDAPPQPVFSNRGPAQ
ncbi:MAG: general secretion pathway protein GspL [Burkholderiales bacterium]|nr:general secretion pathway protein GspL [Burkholderiales bacterium]